MKNFVFLFFFFFTTILYSQVTYNYKSMVTGIHVVSEPNVQVYMDNEYKGETNLASNGLLIEDVNPGIHFIRVNKEGYLEQSRRIYVNGGVITTYPVKPFVPILKISESSNTESQEIDWEAEGGLAQVNFFVFEGTVLRDIVFPLAENSENLIINIYGHISSGELTIEIFNPLGEKQGNFSIKGNFNSKKQASKNDLRRRTQVETTRKRQTENRFLFPPEKRLGSKIAQASISRVITNPMKGNWLIEIKCANAFGDFYIDTNQKIFEGITSSKILHGTITNEKGLPVKGATILMKGLTISVVSDRDGKYYIPVFDYINEIVIKKKGMKTKEISVGTETLGRETKIDIILEKENL